MTETLIDDDSWYVGDRAHRVQAFDPATGAVRWTTDVTPEARFDVATVFGIERSGDTLYAATVRWLTEQGGSVAGDLVALDRRTGAVLFRFTSSPQYDAVNTRGGFQGAPLVHGNLVIVNDVYWHALIAIDRFSGKEVWRTAVEPGGYITSETRPVIVGDTIFAASTDTQVHAVDTRTGHLIWRAVVRPGSLGTLAVCGALLLSREYGAGPMFVTSRATHESYVARGLLEGDLVFSRIATTGNIAVFTTGRGVYAYRCG